MLVVGALLLCCVWARPGYGVTQWQLAPSLRKAPASSPAPAPSLPRGKPREAAAESPHTESRAKPLWEAEAAADHRQLWTVAGGAVVALLALLRSAVLVRNRARAPAAPATELVPAVCTVHTQVQVPRGAAGASEARPSPGFHLFPLSESRCRTVVPTAPFLSESWKFQRAKSV